MIMTLETKYPETKYPETKYPGEKDFPTRKIIENGGAVDHGGVDLIGHDGGGKTSVNNKIAVFIDCIMMQKICLIVIALLLLYYFLNVPKTREGLHYLKQYEGQDNWRNVPSSWPVTQIPAAANFEIIRNRDMNTPLKVAEVMGLGI